MELILVLAFVFFAMIERPLLAVVSVAGLFYMFG